MKLIKKFISFLFSRLLLVALMLVVQLGLIALALLYFSQTAQYAYLLLNLLKYRRIINPQLFIHNWLTLRKYKIGNSR